MARSNRSEQILIELARGDYIAKYLEGTPWLEPGTRENAVFRAVTYQPRGEARNEEIARIRKRAARGDISADEAMRRISAVIREPSAKEKEIRENVARGILTEEQGRKAIEYHRELEKNQSIAKARKRMIMTDLEHNITGGFGNAIGVQSEGYGRVARRVEAIKAADLPEAEKRRLLDKMLGREADERLVVQKKFADMQRQRYGAAMAREARTRQIVQRNIEKIASKYSGVNKDAASAAAKELMPEALDQLKKKAKQIQDEAIERHERAVMRLALRRIRDEIGGQFKAPHKSAALDAIGDYEDMLRRARDISSYSRNVTPGINQKNPEYGIQEVAKILYKRKGEANIDADTALARQRRVADYNAKLKSDQHLRKIIHDLARKESEVEKSIRRLPYTKDYSGSLKALPGRGLRELWNMTGGNIAKAALTPSGRKKLLIGGAASVGLGLAGKAAWDKWGVPLMSERKRNKQLQKEREERAKQNLTKLSSALKLVSFAIDDEDIHSRSAARELDKAAYEQWLKEQRQEAAEALEDKTQVVASKKKSPVKLTPEAERLLAKAESKKQEMLKRAELQHPVLPADFDISALRDESEQRRKMKEYPRPQQAPKPPKPAPQSAISSISQSSARKRPTQKQRGPQSAIGKLKAKMTARRKTVPSAIFVQAAKDVADDVYNRAKARMNINKLPAVATKQRGLSGGAEPEFARGHPYYDEIVETILRPGDAVSGVYGDEILDMRKRLARRIWMMRERNRAARMWREEAAQKAKQADQAIIERDKALANAQKERQEIEGRYKTEIARLNETHENLAKALRQRYAIGLREEARKANAHRWAGGLIGGGLGVGVGGYTGWKLNDANRNRERNKRIAEARARGLSTKEFSIPDKDGDKKKMNPYVIAGLSGGASGAALGALLPLIERDKKGHASKWAKVGKGALVGGLLSGALVGGGSWLGGKIMGEPRSDEASGFTKRGALGGLLLGAGAGAAFPLLAKSAALRARLKGWHKSAKNPIMRWVARQGRAGAVGIQNALRLGAHKYAPMNVIKKLTTGKAVLAGSAVGAAYGGGQGLDEGQQVDSIMNISKDAKRKRNNTVSFASKSKPHVESQDDFERRLDKGTRNTEAGVAAGMIGAGGLVTANALRKPLVGITYGYDGVTRGHMSQAEDAERILRAHNIDTRKYGVYWNVQTGVPATGPDFRGVPIEPHVIVPTGYGVNSPYSPKVKWNPDYHPSSMETKPVVPEKVAQAVGNAKTKDGRRKITIGIYGGGAGMDSYEKVAQLARSGRDVISRVDAVHVYGGKENTERVRRVLRALPSEVASKIKVHGPKPRKTIQRAVRAHTINVGNPGLSTVHEIATSQRPGVIWQAGPDRWRGFPMMHFKHNIAWARSKGIKTGRGQEGVSAIRQILDDLEGAEKAQRKSAEQIVREGHASRQKFVSEVLRKAKAEKLRRGLVGGGLIAAGLGFGADAYRRHKELKRRENESKAVAFAAQPFDDEPAPDQQRNLAVAKHRYLNKIEQQEAVRAIKNYVGSALAGAAVGALLRKKMNVGLKRGAAIGALGGSGIQAIVNSLGKRDEYGDKSYAQKETERIPKYALAGAAGIVAGGKIHGKIKALKEKMARAAAMAEKRGAPQKSAGFFKNLSKALSLSRRGKLIEFDYVGDAADYVSQSVVNQVMRDVKKRDEERRLRRAIRDANKGRQIVERTKRLTRDLGYKIRGEKRYDERGRERKNEWDKSYVRNALITAGLAAAFWAGRKPYKDMKMKAQLIREGKITGTEEPVARLYNAVRGVFKRYEDKAKFPSQKMRMAVLNETPIVKFYKSHRGFSRPFLRMRYYAKNAFEDAKQIMKEMAGRTADKIEKATGQRWWKRVRNSAKSPVDEIAPGVIPAKSPGVPAGSGIESPLEAIAKSPEYDMPESYLRAASKAQSKKQEVEDIKRRAQTAQNQQVTNFSHPYSGERKETYIVPVSEHIRRQRRTKEELNRESLSEERARYAREKWLMGLGGLGAGGGAYFIYDSLSPARQEQRRAAKLGQEAYVQAKLAEEKAMRETIQAIRDAEQKARSKTANNVVRLVARRQAG